MKIFVFDTYPNEYTILADNLGEAIDSLLDHLKQAGDYTTRKTRAGFIKDYEGIIIRVFDMTPGVFSEWSYGGMGGGHNSYFMEPVDMFRMNGIVPKTKKNKRGLII